MTSTSQEILEAAGLRELSIRVKAEDTCSASVLCFSCMRDEILRLPYFLSYHRKLGIDHFYIIDNDSRDGTSAFLSQQPDVTLYRADGSYASSNYGVDWLNALLRAYGERHWCLIVDADELFVYHRCEDRGLRELTAELSFQKGNAMAGFLLDMYGADSISNTHYRGTGSFLEACPYFDADTYYEFTPEGLPARGGPRHRLFWHGRDRPKPPPALHKIPLVRWDHSMALEASTHRIYGVNMCEARCVLMHFKFFSDFCKHARIESTRMQHWDDGYQYGVYNEVLGKNRSMSAMFEGSKYYQNTQQLADLGLITTPWPIATTISKE